MVDPQDQPFANLIVVLDKQRSHRRIHMGAVVEHLFHRRTRQETSFRPRVLLADPVVVRVEEELEGVVKRRIALMERLQEKCLEKPGCVCEVPFRRTRVGHGLDAIVVHRKRAT